MKKKMFDFMNKEKLFHGGEHSKGKRKTARPISSKDALHIVMKSNRAKGEWYWTLQDTPAIFSSHTIWA